MLAAAWGERQSGQEITGFTPGDDARLLLANARDAMNSGDFAVANALFAQVVEMEREQGRDNAEAIAYFGWTLALLTVGDADAEAVGQRLDAARLALDQAIELEPEYADPYCFMAIVEFQFLRRCRRRRCRTSKRARRAIPPSEVADLIAAFAADIRAAAT